jgi:hypothetical protein
MGHNLLRRMVMDQFGIGTGRFPLGEAFLAGGFGTGRGRGSNQKYDKRSQFPHNFFMLRHAPASQ